MYLSLRSSVVLPLSWVSGERAGALGARDLSAAAVRLEPGWLLISPKFSNHFLSHWAAMLLPFFPPHWNSCLCVWVLLRKPLFFYKNWVSSGKWSFPLWFLCDWLMGWLIRVCFALCLWNQEELWLFIFPTLSRWALGVFVVQRSEPPGDVTCWSPEGPPRGRGRQWLWENLHFLSWCPGTRTSGACAVLGPGQQLSDLCLCRYVQPASGKAGKQVVPDMTGLLFQQLPGAPLRTHHHPSPAGSSLKYQPLGPWSTASGLCPGGLLASSAAGLDMHPTWEPLTDPPEFTENRLEHENSLTSLTICWWNQDSNLGVLNACQGFFSISYP